MENHDESSTRLLAALNGVPKGVPIIAPCYATERDLLRVHIPAHIRMIREFSSHGGQYFLDHITYVNSETFDVASYAAGAAVEAVNRTIDGKSCFAIVRPPGHHAESDRAMGYCIFNNVAIAAAAALDRLDKVAIIDWDLHHGNGTQKIFSSDDRVLLDKGWQPRWCNFGEGMVPRRFLTNLKQSSFEGPLCQHHEYENLGTGNEMLANLKKDVATLRQWLE